MNKFCHWVVVMVGIFNTAFGSSVPDRKLDPEALKILFEELGIDQQNVVADTQRKWLRKPGQERWHMSELPNEQKEFVLKWAADQGFFASVKPIKNSYDKALILGATTARMEKRLNYLKQLWSEGVRFKEIVWLTGERPLDSSAERVPDNCKTEVDAAKKIWAEAELPSEMKLLPVVFIASPKTSFKPRPTTDDTILDWLKTSPKPCTCLFISDQPYCGYQFAMVKALVPKDFEPDIAGNGTDPSKDPRAGVNTLDAIARWIYAESRLCSR
jgi:hypothetical protein